MRRAVLDQRPIHGGVPTTHASRSMSQMGSSPLLIALTDTVHPDVIAAVSRALGLPRHQAGHGLQLSVGALSATLATKTHDAYRMRRIFDLVAPPLSLRAPDAGATFVSLLFSAGTGVVARTIATAAGAPRAAGMPFLATTAPLVLDTLGSCAGPMRASPGEFTQWLASERDQLLRATPPPLRPVLGIPANDPPMRHRGCEQAPTRMRLPRIVRASLRLFFS